MIRRMCWVLAVVGLAAMPASAGAANTRDSVTGGGQAFFDGRDMTGAGDTIAFQAHRAKGAAGESELATGQIQVNRRGESNAIKFHGNITCMNVSGEPKSGAGYAYMSGDSRATKTQPSVPFELYVSDGGKGAMERNDMIMLFVGSETANNDSQNEDANAVCGFEDFDPATDSMTMARGNVQVRNRNEDEDDDPSAGTEAAAAAQALSAGLSLLQ